MEISVVETLDCDLTLYVVYVVLLSIVKHLYPLMTYCIQPVHTDTTSTSTSVCPTYAVQLKLQPANISLYEEVGQD